MPSSRWRTAAAAVCANVTAIPSTGSSRASSASRQSAIAERFDTESPMPDRRMRGSLRRT